MYSKGFLIIITTILAFEAKSQILINANSNQIKKQIHSEGGFLKRSFFEKDIKIPGTYRKMIFQFPIKPEGNDCLISKMFYLTLNDKCFEYEEFYWGQNSLNKVINKFSDPSYGLKRIKASSKWINPEKKFEATLIPGRIGNSKTPSVFTLEIKTSYIK